MSSTTIVGISVLVVYTTLIAGFIVTGIGYVKIGAAIASFGGVTFLGTALWLGITGTTY